MKMRAFASCNSLWHFPDYIISFGFYMLTRMLLCFPPSFTLWKQIDKNLPIIQFRYVNSGFLV